VSVARALPLQTPPGQATAVSSLRKDTSALHEGTAARLRAAAALKLQRVVRGHAGRMLVRQVIFDMYSSYDVEEPTGVHLRDVCTHSCIRTYEHTYIYTNMYAYTHTHTHTHGYTHTTTDTHTQPQPHTNKRTNTHMCHESNTSTHIPYTYTHIDTIAEAAAEEDEGRWGAEGQWGAAAAAIHLGHAARDVSGCLSPCSDLCVQARYALNNGDLKAGWQLYSHAREHSSAHHDMRDEVAEAVSALEAALEHTAPSGGERGEGLTRTAKDHLAADQVDAVCQCS